jgi:hypothetical protein
MVRFFHKARSVVSALGLRHLGKDAPWMLRKECLREGDGKAGDGGPLSWRRWSNPFCQGHHDTRVEFFFQLLTPSIPIVTPSQGSLSWKPTPAAPGWWGWRYQQIVNIQSWVGYSITDDIKIRYFVTFKVLKGDVYKVIFLFELMSTRSSSSTVAWLRWLNFPEHDPVLPWSMSDYWWWLYICISYELRYVVCVVN